MHPQTAKGALTNGRNTFRSKELMQASLFTRLNGALDEWLSQRSAKPSTAVRIRQAPHYKVLRPRQTKGFQDFSFQKFYANVPILTYPIDVDPDMNISKIQLMDAILKELSADSFTESEASDFWSDFDNLQKAKIVR